MTVFGGVWAPLPAAQAQTVPRTGLYFPLNPTRILDTRDGTGGISGALLGGQTIRVQVAGRGGVPAAGATAVVLNVTAAFPTAAGHLTVWPTGTAQPTTSVLNFPANRNVPNLVQVKLGDGGGLNVTTPAGAVHAIFDVSGYYGGEGAGSTQFRANTPGRVYDSRVAGAGGRLLPKQSVILGSNDAATVAALALNVTVTGPAVEGFVAVFANGIPTPFVSNINFQAGQTVANNVITRLSSGREYVVYNGSDGPLDVVVDQNGYFVSGATDSGGLFRPLEPARRFDSRTAGLGKLGPGATFEGNLTNVLGVPGFAAVSAVVMNLTVTEGTAPSYLVYYSKDITPPPVSNINFVAGQTVANHAIIPAGTRSDTGVVFNLAGSVHEIEDYFGYYT